MDNTFLKEHYETLYHRCYRLLGDKTLAYDAMQEVFTRFFERLEKRDLEKPLQYLYRISTNLCLDLLRYNQRTLPVEPSQIQNFAKTDTEANDNRLIVQKLVEHFGDEEVKLLVYRYVDRMTYAELGEFYGKSDRGIKKRVDKLQKNFHRYLSKQ